MSATPPPGLRSETLPIARPGTRVFAYDRSRLRPRIVHLGLGAFFRAHGALYVDDLLNEDGGDWGIVGASPRHPGQRDRLVPQDCLYTALETGREGGAPRVVGCLLDVLVGPANPEALLARLAAPDTAVVTLTVTEKGYGHDPASGRLDPTHPDILHDLAHPAAPRSAVGVIVAALARRRTAGQRPFTVATCDNLPDNGALLAGLARDFAALRDDRLATWIEAEGAFPGSMVDRIVPAGEAGDVDRVAALTGLTDAAPVLHERFRQWVLEDRFVGGVRPPLQRVGVEVVGDVRPFERAKLRMLNGAHSALAYLGHLGGHETIADAVADPDVAAYLRRLWRDEIVPTLRPPPGMPLAAYAEVLFGRFADPATRHRTPQIAMDGSQKLPQRILGTLRDNRAAGRPFPGLALAVAGFIRHLGGLDDAGRPFEVRDPLAPLLRRLLDAAGPGPAERVRAILGVEAIFGTDLAADAAVVVAVTAASADLAHQGARAVLARYADRDGSGGEDRR